MQEECTVSQALMNRRTMMAFAAGSVGATVVGEAEAEPLTGLAVLFWAGVALLGTAAIAHAANQAKWRERSEADRSTLPPFGQPQEMKPFDWGTVYGEADGGAIVCDRGTLRGRLPGATTLAPNSDLSITEALLCSGIAPYTDQQRRALPQTAESTKDRLEELSRIWGTPMQRMRYIRRVSTARGVPHVILSSIPRVNNKIEVLTLVDISGQSPRALRGQVAKPWTLVNAKDFV